MQVCNGGTAEEARTCRSSSTHQAPKCYLRTFLVSKWPTSHSDYMPANFYYSRLRYNAICVAFQPSEMSTMSPNARPSAGFHNWDFVLSVWAARLIMKIFNKISLRYNLQSNHQLDLSSLFLIPFAKSKSLILISSHKSLTLLAHIKKQLFLQINFFPIFRLTVHT